MKNESPEKMFAIKDSENTESDKKPENIKIDDDKISPENEKGLDNKIESAEFSVESLKDQLKKDNINIDDKTINNYYNQISENKKHITEYNTTIQNLESLKKDYNTKVEEKGETPELSKISKQISSIEEKLADLNVEKQKKEDAIKHVIHEIYKEDTKTENIENVSKVDNTITTNNKFESKNKLLNLTLNPSKENVVNKKEEIDTKKKANDLSEKKEEPQLIPKKSEDKSFLGEDNAATSKSEDKSTSKEDVDNSFDSFKKEEENPETNKEKKSENEGSSIDVLFKKLSDDMSKGFESVLLAIGSGAKSREEPSPKAEEQKEQKEQSGKPPTYEDKPKQKQQNYIEDYRKSLRSNAPLEGMVGIKGLELKVNNIGSYI
jgi:hypothetical protein